MLSKITRLAALAFLPLFLAGCHTITNLTPATLPRNSSGVYQVEVKFDHKEQALRQETIKPLVLIGENTYPMERTRLMQNRWETLIPVPANKGEVYYRFKFDYKINTFSQPPRDDSKLSPEYKLSVKD